MDAVSTGGDGNFGTPRILVDLMDGHLAEGEAAAVVAWLTADGIEDAPPRIVNRAVRIARYGSADRAPRPRLWRRRTAALVYDSRDSHAAMRRHLAACEGAGWPDEEAHLRDLLATVESTMRRDRAAAQSASWRRLRRAIKDALQAA